MKMELSNVEITVNEPKDKKIRIIALTGRKGIPLHAIAEYLIKRKNVLRIERIAVGTDISIEKFLNKMLSGEIIEATTNHNIISGTDITTLMEGFLHIGVFTPEQISILDECKDPRVEVLPIEIEMENKERLLTLIADYDGDVDKACIAYLEDKKEYDGDEYLDGLACMWTIFSDLQDIEKNLRNNEFVERIKSFNDSQNCLSNLDNLL